MESVTVILSTYNQPEWLQKSLWGFEQQTVSDFNIIIADDGSTDETKSLIENFQKESSLKIVHLWQEDLGFRKTVILNKAIMATNADYLIFSDGDCIPRKDLVQQHLNMRKEGTFLSGGYFKLNEYVSSIVSKEDIQKQNCFNPQWLISQGMKKNFKFNKLTQLPFKQRFLNWITPTKATWDGNNVSGWREDILAVNGFDERMQYGGEDRELGERLMNNGIKAVQARYTLVTAHLEHTRGYVKEAMIKKNKEIRKQTKKNKSTWTSYGIKRDS